MIYYGMVMAAVLMFSVQFFFNQLYEMSYGNGLRAVVVFTLGSNAIGAVILLVIAGFKMSITPFALLMAVLAAADSLGYTYCSLKALSKINLSAFSVFAMLGGMTLPFIAGICFYNEELTPGKILCFVAVGISLFFTVNFKDKKGGYIYYAGIFLLNGASGVISKIYQAAPFAKASSESYSILCALVLVVISAALLPVVNKIDPTPARKINGIVLFSLGGYGILCRVANLLLLIALDYLPASAQYPMITGGVMVFSVLIDALRRQKPSRKELAAVTLSFIGIVLLVVLP